MTESTSDPLVEAVHVDDIAPAEVAAGIVRRRLPATDFARGWLIDFAPGTEWPEVDHHHAEERYFVISGEIIDNDRCYRAGTYVVFAPGSSHRPRSETGARIIGISDTRG
jgi:quercetin dioxygenase-like cupin family protein